VKNIVEKGSRKSSHPEKHLFKKLENKYLKNYLFFHSLGLKKIPYIFKDKIL
jgi:hypothetical protein